MDPVLPGSPVEYPSCPRARVRDHNGPLSVGRYYDEHPDKIKPGMQSAISLKEGCWQSAALATAPHFSVHVSSAESPSTFGILSRCTRRQQRRRGPEPVTVTRCKGSHPLDETHGTAHSTDQQAINAQSPRLNPAFNFISIWPASPSSRTGHAGWFHHRESLTRVFPTARRPE